jgi:hypothetical protein
MGLAATSGLKLANSERMIR